MGDVAFEGVEVPMKDGGVAEEVAYIWDEGGGGDVGYVGVVMLAGLEEEAMGEEGEEEETMVEERTEEMCEVSIWIVSA